MKSHRPAWLNAVTSASAGVARGLSGASNALRLDRLGGVADKAGDVVEGALDWGRGLLGGGHDEDQALPGPACFLGPFENGVTRGDFAWALGLQRPDLGIDGASREAAVASAQAAGIFSGRADDAPTRAEVAEMLRRALGLGDAPPASGVAYFLDVPESECFFSAAHLCRMNGLFKGGEGDNRFRGGAEIGLAEAWIVLGRTVAAAPIPVEDQVSGTQPLLEPANVLAELEAGSLDPARIDEAREAVSALPEGERAGWYRQIAAAVGYANQRNNDATYAGADARKWGYRQGGDVMCNFTSISMALEQLGFSGTGARQFEDELDEAFVEAGYTNRYDKTQRGRFVGDRFGVDVGTLWVSGDKRTFFLNNVLPILERGGSATMGNAGGDLYSYNHIVRIEWVTDEGLIVDDPFGRVVENSWGKLTYDLNDASSEQGGGAKGADNLWTWAWLAKTRPSYVSTFER